MTLAPGTRLGPYEIRSPLGAGGMGEVYRARDTRLGRDVAVKVLPDDVAANPKALVRFESEARAVAALSHPNILALHDVGEAGSVRYAVTELLEGETLRALVTRGALPVKRALEVAQQVADGLAAAHEKGIVHRDLKPENVFLTKDGRTKVLDFGLAAIRGVPAGLGSDTRSPTAPVLTETGAVVGTVAYMSPEQARGEVVDFRTDQFSLGIVLYEMLTGRRPFKGVSAVDLLAAIVRDDPEPLEKAAPHLPAPVCWVAERLLSKQPSDRYDSTRDLAVELRLLVGRIPRSTSGASAATPSSRAPGWRIGLAAAIAGVALGVGASRLLVREAPSPAPPVFSRVTFSPATHGRGFFGPDGTSIVYSAQKGRRDEVFLLSPGSREARPLGVEGSVASVSASGEMALLKDGVLSVVALGGGAPRPLLKDVVSAGWAPDGKSLALVRRAEGKLRLEYPAGRVLPVDCVGTAVSVSPDGGRLAFRCGGDLMVVDGKGRQTKLASKSSTEFLWLPGGEELLFTRLDRGATDLFAVSPAGRERLVASLPGTFFVLDAAPDGRLLLEHGASSFATVGRLAGDREDRDLRWLDATTPAEFSPDGKKLLFSELSEAGFGATTYLRDAGASTPVMLGPGFALSLSPDGEWALVLPSIGAESYRLLPTGPGDALTLPSGGLESLGPAAFLPEGKEIVFSSRRKGGKPRIYAQEVPAGTPRPISPEGAVIDEYCRPSPDGRLVLGLARPGGRGKGAYRLYPRQGGEGHPVPGMAAGEVPVGWTADGKALYVAREDDDPIRVALLDVATGARRAWKEIPHPFPGQTTASAALRITPDGASYVVSYSRWLSDLFVLEGVR